MQNLGSLIKTLESLDMMMNGNHNHELDKDIHASLKAHEYPLHQVPLNGIV